MSRLAELFMVAANLADIDPRHLAECREIISWEGYDDEVAVWAGSPARALEIKALAYALSRNWRADDYVRESLWPLWRQCVEEEPRLAWEWIDFEEAFDVAGNPLWS